MVSFKGIGEEPAINPYAAGDEFKNFSSCFATLLLRFLYSLVFAFDVVRLFSAFLRPFFTTSGLPVLIRFCISSFSFEVSFWSFTFFEYSLALFFLFSVFFAGFFFLYSLAFLAASPAMLLFLTFGKALFFSLPLYFFLDFSYSFVRAFVLDLEFWILDLSIFALWLKSIPLSTV